MSTPGSLGQLLDALDAMPPLAAVVVHGCPSDALPPSGTLVVTAPLSTSRNPAVALAHRGGALLGLMTRTGRATASLSARPQDDEVVLRPGSLLTSVGAVRLRGHDVLVHVLDELVPPGEGTLPGDTEARVFVAERGCSESMTTMRTTGRSVMRRAFRGPRFRRNPTLPRGILSNR